MSRVSGLEAPEQAVWTRVPAQAVRQEDSGGQRSLACCRPRAHRVNHDLATEQLIKKRPPRHTFNRISGTPSGASRVDTENSPSQEWLPRGGLGGRRGGQKCSSEQASGPLPGRDLCPHGGGALFPRHGKEALQFLQGGDPDCHPDRAGSFCKSGAGGILECMDGIR